VGGVARSSLEKCYQFTELAVQLNEMEVGVAPTDSRCRPDQRLMELGRWDDANACKLVLEDKQRTARRQREREMEQAAATGTHRQTDREMEQVQTDRQTDAQVHTDRQTERWNRCRQTDRQTHRYTQTDRQRDGTDAQVQTDRQTQGRLLHRSRCLLVEVGGSDFFPVASCNFALMLFKLHEMW